MEAQLSDAPIVFCDTVQSVAIHNGIVRVSFIRLDTVGKNMPALELLMPFGQVASLMKALQSVARAGQVISAAA
jgi:hypothetical protein